MKNRTTVERKSERELVVTRAFDAPARIVFEAWTKPAVFMRWWGSKSKGMSLLSCEMDVRVGGGYRLVFAQGMEFFGRYIEVTPHSRLVWTNDEGGEDGPVTAVTFGEKGGQTLLVMHELYPSKEALDAAGTGAADGMGELFGQLDELLVTLNTITLQTDRGTTMTSPMYTNSVPVFKQLLLALKAILAQADAYAAAKSIEPDAFLQARLYPDMFPLLKQVQIATDFARGISARLAGVEVPNYESKEKTFADLDQLLAQTLDFLDGVNVSLFEGSEAKEIVLRPGTPKEKKLRGQAYLASYGLPQFFFHVTTAYAILRHNGLAVGKRDYMGAY